MQFEGSLPMVSAVLGSGQGLHRLKDLHCPRF